MDVHSASEAAAAKEASEELREVERESASVRVD
jgi:hypothetical protein